MTMTMMMMEATKKKTLPRLARLVCTAATFPPCLHPPPPYRRPPLARAFAAAPGGGGSEAVGRHAARRPPPLSLAAGGGEPQPALVDAVLGAGCMPAAEVNRQAVVDARLRFARHATDTGSPEVQVAALTHRIKTLTAHLQLHRKDVHTRKGLLALLDDRKRHLKYLRRTDLPRYASLIASLDLKDRPFSEPKYAHAPPSRRTKKKRK